MADRLDTGRRCYLDPEGEGEEGEESGLSPPGPHLPQGLGALDAPTARLPAGPPGRGPPWSSGDVSTQGCPLPAPLLPSLLSFPGSRLCGTRGPGPPHTPQHRCRGVLLKTQRPPPSPRCRRGRCAPRLHRSCWRTQNGGGWGSVTAARSQSGSLKGAHEDRS
ncbi:Hypothetical predicted protein [Lynx pardinus]|uniref:Uncharacterized protein n=1 Tax=Lynx pardinus TaxID=191816 RepID=A0A485PA57_LYNPA|nr:Hypothetical predicted protein [Lynx pardinus]